MTASIAAFVLVTRRDGGRSRWLARWDERLSGMHLVGGSLRDGESPRDRAQRAAREELGLQTDTQFRLSQRPAARLEQVAPGAPTEDVDMLELFALELASPADVDRVTEDSQHGWLTADEIRDLRTNDGRPVSELLRRLMRRIGRLPDGPPDPATQLVVGVTGHRDLRAADRRTIVQRLRRVFDDAERQAAGAPLVVFSPLAAGADQLVAEIALTRSYRLVAPLPLPVDDYLADFAPGSERNDFLRLLDSAGEWYALPRVPATGDDGGPLDPRDRRRRAYAAVGQHVVDRSHLLIALWDGRAGDGGGGTADTLRYATETATGEDGLLRIGLVPVRRASE